MNYSIFKSRTFWTAIFAFLYNGYAAISGTMAPDVTVVVNGIFSILIMVFHFNPSQNYTTPPQA